MTHPTLRRVSSSDNKMYATNWIERKTNNTLNNLIFHYHNYDRKYYVQGKKDKYYSESLVAKAETEMVHDSNYHMDLEVNINMIGVITKLRHFLLKQEDM